LAVRGALEIPETLGQVLVTPVLVVAVAVVELGQNGLIFAALFVKTLEEVVDVEVEVGVLLAQIKVQVVLLTQLLVETPVTQGVQGVQVIPAALRVTPAMLET
jgi:hypothetical protein